MAKILRAGAGVRVSIDSIPFELSPKGLVVVETDDQMRNRLAARFPSTHEAATTAVARALSGTLEFTIIPCRYCKKAGRMHTGVKATGHPLNRERLLWS